MERVVSLCLLLLTLVQFGYAEEDVVIVSPEVTPFGDWGKWENCSQGKFVTAFQLKVEGKHSVVDDTGLNGVRFYCGRPVTTVDEHNNSTTSWENVTSSVGPFGRWGSVHTCPTHAVGFDLEVQQPQGHYKDDVGAINMKLVCGDGSQIEGYSNNGNDHLFPNVTYTGVQRCPTGYGLCGIRTRVEPYQILGDDTGLNNVAGKCCALTNLLPVGLGDDRLG